MKFFFGLIRLLQCTTVKSYYIYVRIEENLNDQLTSPPVDAVMTNMFDRHTVNMNRNCGITGIGTQT